MTTTNDTPKWNAIALRYAHKEGREWIENLIRLHERQIEELKRYLLQYDVAATNEAKPRDDQDRRVPTTTSILSYTANTLSVVPANVRVDLLPNITAAIVTSLNK